MRLLALVRQFYYTEQSALALLLIIGYPMDTVPAFKSAETFWPVVLKTLDDKVDGGSKALQDAISKAYPDSPGVKELAGEWTEEMVVVEATVVNVLPEQLARPSNVSVPGVVDEGAPPPPPNGIVGTGLRARTLGCPTLALEGADLASQFFRLTRRILGPEVTELYVARDQSALRIPDPGEDDERVRREIENGMRAYAPDCRVSFRIFPFQPKLYKRIVVYGPDTTGYELTAVPSISTPEDIAAAMLAETRELKSGDEGLVRVVVDHERSEFSQRLDPYTTLHECGVKDGDRLRVALWAIAGSLAPRLRLEHALRAAAQLRAHAANDPAFAIDGVDDEDLPSRITMTIDARGLAPPADLEAHATGSALDDIVPRHVRVHRVSIHLHAMFPLEAPRIVWETPVFHPNILLTARAGLPAGTVHLPPILLDYRPELDLAHIARVLTDIARYRSYDLTPGDAAPNPAATRWAATESGQTTIRAIGGRVLADAVRQNNRGAGPSRLFWIKPLGEVSHGV